MLSILTPSEGLPKPPPHPREIERLASLCGTPFGTVTLVQEHEQFFLGNEGMPERSGDRNEAICAYTILQHDPLVVEDVSKDDRFAHYATVKGSPHLRFYAGAPILDRNGLPLGSVCALGPASREIGAGPLFTLQRLAAMAGVFLEARRLAVELLGPGATATARARTLVRLDDVMAPLIGRANGFRRSLPEA